MKEDLQRLIDLQKVDTELDDLEEQKGDLPQVVQKLKEELVGFRETYREKSDLLTEAKRLKLHWEGELQSLQEALRKHQDQLYSVTTNREYDAITIEIDTLKEKVSDAETQILELIEKEELLTEEIESLAGQIESREESLTSKEQDLNTKINANEALCQSLENNRREIVGQLNKPILYQYERIRKVKGNTAVVGIKKYTCGGCFAAIPPQRALEVRHMNQLILCESCGRILVDYNSKKAVPQT
ncbi:C4-type zinc ribbon domain-containing protein [bacterium]|nr:C4-type zinc ribbon domain-containing protein [bacterium]